MVLRFLNGLPEQHRCAPNLSRRHRCSHTYRTWLAVRRVRILATAACLADEPNFRLGPNAAISARNQCSGLGWQPMTSARHRHQTIEVQKLRLGVPFLVCEVLTLGTADLPLDAVFVKAAKQLVGRRVRSSGAERRRFWAGNHGLPHSGRVRPNLDPLVFARFHCLRACVSNASSAAGSFNNGSQ